MNATHSNVFLRRVLWVDALASAAMGLGLLAFAEALAQLLQLPAVLLREAGIILVPFAAFVAFLASRAEPPRAGVWAVIVLNAIWVIESAFLLIAGWVEPNALGYAFVIAQALAVATFAELEYLGLCKAAPLAA